MWWIVIALVAGTFGLQLLGTVVSEGPGADVPIAEAEATLASYQAFGQVLPGGKDGEKAPPDAIREAVDSLLEVTGADRDAAFRAAAVLQKEYGVGDAAKTVAKLRQKPKDPEEALRNRLWRAIYGGRPFSPGDAVRGERLLRNDSVLDRCALVHLLSRTGPTARADSERERLVVLSKSAALTVFGIVGLLGFAGLIGLGLVVWFFLRPSPPHPNWDVGTADGLAEAFCAENLIFLFIGGAVPVAAMLLLRLSLDDSILLVATLGTAVSFVLSFRYLRWAAGRYGFTLRELGWHADEFWKNVLWGVGGVFATACVSGVLGIAGYFLFQFLPQGTNDIGEIAEGAQSPWTWIGLFAAGAVLAPLTEETFFRGVLFMGLWRRLKRFWPAAVLSSLAFGLVHPQLFAGLGAVVGVGLVSCALLRERRSLVPCIVMHAIYNGALFLTAMFAY